MTPPLFEPLTLPNLIVVSPMAQYSADRDGMVQDWHLVHYGSLAASGAGLVILEATAVLPEGRVSPNCLGLWEDAQVPGMRDLASAVQAHGARIGLQISHGGRKASAQGAWQGNGPLTAQNLAAGDIAGTPEGPDDQPFAEGWPQPEAPSVAEIRAIFEDFRATARRAASAGFDLIELHMAHGYLLQSFLPPVANHRTDAYGGSLENRMRLALEIAEAVRALLPDSMPLLARISATDWSDGGWTIDDSVILAAELKARGVDLVDCYSGGNLVRGTTNASLGRGPGYQVPFARRIREDVGVPTMAVGKIHSGAQAEAILQAGHGDLIAIGRQLLYDPFWTLHAARALTWDMDFDLWPRPYGWWLEKWAKSLDGSERSLMQTGKELHRSSNCEERP